MNIYLVSRIDEVRYDQFVAFVCRAEDETTAINMKPSPSSDSDQWSRSVSFLQAELLAASVAGQREVILASYNGS